MLQCDIGNEMVREAEWFQCGELAARLGCKQLHKGYCSRHMASLCDEVELRDTLRPNLITTTPTITNVQDEDEHFSQKGNGFT